MFHAKWYTIGLAAAQAIQTLGQTFETLPLGVNVYILTIGGALRLKSGVALGGALLAVDAGDSPPVRDSGV